MRSSIISVNEPAGVKEAMSTPVSINEPQLKTEQPAEQPVEQSTKQPAEPPAKPAVTEFRDPGTTNDPDELEEEIEQAGEEGDFQPMHRSKPKKR